MISEIINALTQELKYFSRSNDAMVVFDTNLNEDIEFSLPLIVLEFNNAPESARLPGNGVTRMDWSFNVRVYASEPDAYIDDDKTGSVAHLNFADAVRNYLENENWHLQIMKDLTTNYHFRITYNGTVPATPLQTEDKMYMGYSHMFESISVDNTINYTTDMIAQTQAVTGTVEFI